MTSSRPTGLVCFVVLLLLFLTYFFGCSQGRCSCNVLLFSLRLGYELRSEANGGMLPTAKVSEQPLEAGLFWRHIIALLLAQRCVAARLPFYFLVHSFIHAFMH